jgi:enamine deaminase RidA (YjgF/YER057c/UK114 family)
MRQQFIVKTPDILKTYIYKDNRPVVANSGTMTVYKPSSTEKLIDNAAMTVAADGLLSYSLTATHNDVAGENYKAVIAYVYNSTTYYLTLFYDVVNSILRKVITDEDIVNELPQLKDNGWKVHGTADSGSTTTIVDANLKRYPDDYFTGGLAYSIDKDEMQEITDFVSSTGTVTTVAFSGAIATDKYILTRSYTREIDRAFEKIDELLKRSGKRAHLILDPYDLREAHIMFSVAEVCKGLAIDSENLWWSLWKEYEKSGAEVLRTLEFKYDSSVDGYIAGSERDSVLSTVRAGRR